MYLITTIITITSIYLHIYNCHYLAIKYYYYLITLIYIYLFYNVISIYFATLP